MNIDDVLSQIRKSETEKTASAAPTAPSDTELAQALDEFVAPAAEKTASAAGSPVDELQKLAADLLEADDKRMEEKVAHYARIFTDASAERLRAWDQAIEKTASTTDAGSLEKFAAENPELFKQALELGYREEMARQEKTAQEDYSNAFEATEDGIRKQAAYEFQNGMVTTDQYLTILEQQG